MATVDPPHYHFLESRPGSNYRQLFVKGRRIRALVVDAYVNGPEPYSPEQVALELQIPIEAVHEALDYVQRHRDVIRADYDMETERLRELGLVGRGLHEDPAR